MKAPEGTVQGPQMVASFEVPVLLIEVPLRRHSRCHVRHHPRTLGTKSGTKIWDQKFGGFIDTSDQNEQYHTKLLDYPLKWWIVEHH